MTSHRFHEDVDAREQITVLWASLIQVGEVYAHLLLVVRFFDHDHIGQPFGVVDFFDEIYLQQLAYLFSYGFVPFLGENPFLLLDWGEAWAYVELVYHGTGANP